MNEDRTNMTHGETKANVLRYSSFSPHHYFSTRAEALSVTVHRCGQIEIIVKPEIVKSTPMKATGVMDISSDTNNCATTMMHRRLDTLAVACNSTVRR